jgi:hypothetical protein
MGRREPVREPRQQQVDCQIEHESGSQFHINLRCKR